MPIATVNPTTGQTIDTFEPLGMLGVEERVARAAGAFGTYRTSGLAERAGRLRAAADVLESGREETARTVTLEMGKPIGQARAEVDKCAKAMRWFADHAAGLLADERVDPAQAHDAGASAVMVRYRPLGPVLAVMPWNFPLWQVIRFAAPALMAGNVVLLKHASNVPRTALLLEQVFLRAGYPQGCFQTLLVGSDAVERIVRDQRVAAVTLTGSEAAGRAVAAVASDAVKKSVLELGGSDPFLVLPSADVERAAQVAVTARVQNNGQSCIAAKRFIIHSEVYERFTSAFTERMSALRVGDPMDADTEVGPLAGESGRADLEALVEDALRQGARALCGAKRPADRPDGWFYEPTVLTGIGTGMRIHQEECFGPVAALYQVGSLNEAIELANATPFGLSSSAWTQDLAEQQILERDLQAGGIFFNGMTASHPALPFGGVKRSGYGRELAAHGLREFCNLTTLWYG